VVDCDMVRAVRKGLKISADVGNASEGHGL
jgi:hypothetical protein